MQPTISLASLCVRDPEVPSFNPPHQVPLVAASSFTFETLEQGMRIFDGEEAGHIYSRFGNPTIDAASGKLAALEGHGTGLQPAALLTSSGMGAIHALLHALLSPGDRVLTQADLYGGTAALLRDRFGPWGVETTAVDLRNAEATEQELRRGGVRLIYCETPSNPTLRCTDLSLLADLCRRYDALLVADNTFATPVLQQPLALGADFVLHSTTKYLNGHGTGVGGVIVGRDADWMQQQLAPALRLLGPSANAWDAWLILNGLKTLALRMERHCRNASRLAAWLQGQPAVERVNYPGLTDHPEHQLAARQMTDFGGMLSFELRGGLEAGRKFMNALSMCTITPTLGDVDTIVLHPASMSHRALPPEVRQQHGITDGLVRISVGIETLEDIRDDMARALEQLP